MPGLGVSFLGSGYVGSASGPAGNRSLGDFNFQISANSIGFKIDISIDIPGLAEAPEWDRELRVLRKIGEWPQGYDDADAEIVVAKTYATTGDFTDTFEDSDLLAGQIYYYALYEKRTDDYWLHDSFLGRGSAYPYDRWGAGEYLFKSMPHGWQRQDVDQGDALQNFLMIFGALVDDIKTDAENLRTLFEIDSIHADLLPYLDAKIAWPTWLANNGLSRRQETKNAVDAYKLIGREQAYEVLIEGVSGWDAEIEEGWRYVMFSNGLYGCTTPDTTDPNLLPNVGLTSDLLKYTNDDNSWHSLSGIVFMLSEIPGVSGEFTQAMVYRYHELIELVSATFVNYNLYLIPITEELFPMTGVVDDWDHGDDVYTYSEILPGAPLDEDVGATTTSLTLFESNDTSATTTTATDRTFHSALTYL